MDLRVKILECLDQLDKFYGEGTTDRAREMVDNAGEDEKNLFAMYQTLREEIAAVAGDKAENVGFKVKKENGEIVEVNNLEGARKLVSGNQSSSWNDS